MPWLTLLTNRWTWIIAAFALCCAALGIQTTRLKWVQAEYATFQASVAKEAADAKVAAARQEALHAINAQEAIDALQTRNVALGARYERLRANPPRCPVSAVPGAAEQPGPVAGSTVEPDPLARCLRAVEWGDKELAKYASLWNDWKANAAKQP